MPPSPECRGELDAHRRGGRALLGLADLGHLRAAHLGIGDADIAGMHRQIERAEQLAVSGDYEAAARLLNPVVDRDRFARIYEEHVLALKGAYQMSE